MVSKAPTMDKSLLNINIIYVHLSKGAYQVMPVHYYISLIISCLSLRHPSIHLANKHLMNTH